LEVVTYPSTTPANKTVAEIKLGLPKPRVTIGQERHVQTCTPAKNRPGPMQRESL
jgi:hypothetical protein